MYMFQYIATSWKSVFVDLALFTFIFFHHSSSRSHRERGRPVSASCTTADCCCRRDDLSFFRSPLLLFHHHFTCSQNTKYRHEQPRNTYTWAGVYIIQRGPTLTLKRCYTRTKRHFPKPKLCLRKDVNTLLRLLTNVL